MLLENITGFVLAGGRSLRMGHDKAQIRWNGGTLLSHAAEGLSQIAARVVVVGAVDVGNAPQSTLADSALGRGPLAGIHAALAHTTTAWNLMVAVDLPLVSARLLGFIAGYCGGRARLVVVPKVGGKLQPLCAAYHRDLLEEVERALSTGELSIYRLLERVS